MQPQKAKRLRQFLRLMGALLFVQGAAVLLFLAFSISIPTVLSRAIRPDPLHAWIHLSWAALIGAGLQRRRTLTLGWSFGAFYWLFGVLGLVLHHPLGLLLDLGENGFHLIVGAIALLLSFTASPLRSARETR